MIDYLRLESRLVAGRWAWLLLGLFGALRASGVVSPSDGWLVFLSVAYPLLVAITAAHLLDQERRWKTLQVLIATPMSSQAVLAIRFFVLAAPIIALPFVLVHPIEVLELLAPAVLLASVVLTLGCASKAGWGAAVALTWWIVSFLLFVTAPSQGSVCLVWISVIATPQTSPGTIDPAIALTKLGVAALLFAIPAVRQTRIFSRHREP